MGLLDMFKDKAAELVQGAKDQVTEFTGTEPGVDGVVGAGAEHADQAGQAAGDLGQAAGDFGQTAGDLGQQGQDLVENTGTTAGDAVNRFLGE